MYKRQARQLQGKQLSYNNINDTDAAFELVGEFDPNRCAAVAIIKHANPCGVAEGASLKAAYAKALACDPVSAFGGIVAMNRTLDAEAAGLAEPLTKGSVVASDAFFPFADGLISAIEAGATAVIQPGGSMRDDDVIAAADAHGIAMVFTGVRHFRH